MTWHDLLFMHWPIESELLARWLPKNLTIDTFEGQAWISVVPFRMSGVAPRWVPDIPWMSSFPELNVRTYVTVNDNPGVWFFSLDATNPIAVRAARMLFHLNYVDARIGIELEENWYRYHSVRTDKKYPPSELRVDYRPIGDSFLAEPGSLEDWLTARYCLYAASPRGQLFCGEIDHTAWKLRRAQAVIHENSMLHHYGLNATEPAMLQFAERTEVLAWSLSPIEMGQ